MRKRHKNTTALTSPYLRSCLSRARCFLRDESGAMAAPACFTILAMVAVGGIGVDLMRMERDRTLLQYTLDRAVLAAADLDQPKAPDAVVLDYLTKSGLEEYYQTPWWESGIGFKKVQGTIDTTFPTHLLQHAGVDELPMYATSRAEESIDGLEISLVLDVSGSMGSNSRLDNLKVAAKDFIDTMVASTTEGKMSISIVPYATQVSLPESLYDLYNIDTPADSDGNIHSRCVNFTASDFQTTTLSPTAELEGTMHFTPWDSTSRDNRTRYTNPTLISTPVCEDDSSREILPFQKDATVLKNYIENFDAGGNTSIDIGMKWGTALLDPTARPVINALTTGTGATVPSDFSARPAEYNDSDTVKVIVLMTDGQNTSQYYVESDHREGNSNVWYDSATRRYSTYNPSNGRYYWHDVSSYWQTQPYGNNPERLNWADLFAYTSLKYLYYGLYRDWMGTSSARNTWYYGVYDSYGNSTKNTRTRNICQAAKDQGIIVYTIGFEAPSNGVAVLQDCASSDSHYFDVQGLEISDAFASIATSIRQLRLTQ